MPWFTNNSSSQVTSYTDPLTLADIEMGMILREKHQNVNKVAAKAEIHIICYLSAVILAILVLIVVIVLLTAMVATKEDGFS